MSGILNVHKPSGITSRDVVNRVDRMVRPLRSGHAGTLDPLASGVLVVCVGPATRLIEYIQRMPKSYRAAFRLGLASDTDDIEGNVEAVPVERPPSRDEVLEQLKRFQGPIDQVPPNYSAVKLQGRRAYELARAQKSFVLQPRRVTIHRLTLLEYQFPDMRVDIECSSGTYVRALGRDIAEGLGTRAVMTELVRTAVGRFRIEDAVLLDELDRAKLAKRLLPPGEAVAELPSIELAPGEPERLLNGQAITRRDVPPREAEIAAFDEHGNLVAILRGARAGQLRPVKCFPPSRETG